MINLRYMPRVYMTNRTHGMEKKKLITVQHLYGIDCDARSPTYAIAKNNWEILSVLNKNYFIVKFISLITS